MTHGTFFVRCLLCVHFFSFTWNRLDFIFFVIKCECGTTYIECNEKRQLTAKYRNTAWESRNTKSSGAGIIWSITNKTIKIMICNRDHGTKSTSTHYWYFSVSIYVPCKVSVRYWDGKSAQLACPNLYKNDIFIHLVLEWQSIPMWVCF